jgi:hypothetical protein
MATEAGGGASRGGAPRPFLLIILGLLVVVFVVMKLAGSAGPRQPASNSSRVAQHPALAQTPASPGRGNKNAPVDPGSLDVHLESLSEPRAGAAANERNPFRFRPPPPPPAPPPSKKPPSGPPAAVAETPIAPPPAPAPPPITVKFIGVIDKEDGTRLAMFVDCSAGRRQSVAREGAVIDGRYRLVKIQTQSAIVEHLDGRGRTTLAQSGQECVK